MALALTASGVAGETASPVADELRQFLLGREFASTVDLGLAVRGRGGEMTPVATAIEEAGHVSYRRRKSLGNLFSGWLLRREVDVVVPHGTRVRVDGVELQDRRLELTLVRPGLSQPARLLAEFSSDSELRRSSTLLLRRLTRALDLGSRYEELLAAMKQQEDAELAAASARSAIASARSDLDRFEATGVLMGVLTDLEGARKQLKELLGRPAAADAAEEAREVAARLRELEARTRPERIERAHKRVESEVAAAEAVAAEWQAPVPDARRIEAGREVATRYRERLEARALAIDALAALDPAVARLRDALDGDRKRLQGWEQALERAATRLGALEQKRESEDLLARLHREYTSLSRRRKELFDEYTAAYGSAREASLGRAYLQHLRMMAVNRQAASEHGIQDADRVVSELNREIERIERILAASR